MAGNGKYVRDNESWMDILYDALQYLMQQQAPLSPVSPSTFGAGEKDVADADVPEALVASSTPCSRVFIKAKEGITGDFVRIGVQGSELMEVNTGGVPLVVSDLQNIYVDVESDGDGVTFIYS